MKEVLVCGAGGFIGGWLAKHLIEDNHCVRCVDIKPLSKWWQHHIDADNWDGWDLRDPDGAYLACAGQDEVYQLAADMGGIGIITQYYARLARNNSLININMLDAVRSNRVERYLFSSSACVYNQQLQQSPDTMPLKEEDAWPADPDSAYGLEKLYAEKLCEYYAQDYGLDVRIARFHNVHGPYGSWNDGTEKAPAAACRKVAETKENGEVLIWGDGQQT